MNYYRLDQTKLDWALREAGFKNMNEWIQTSIINRATVHHYLKGKGPLNQAYYKLCETLQVDPLDLLTPYQKAAPFSVESSEILPLIQKLTQGGKNIAIGLFGSRVRQTSKEYSDYDLGVTGGANPLSTTEYLRLKETLDDLAEDLPYGVDLIRLDQAPLVFLGKIAYEPIFLGGDKARWSYFLGALHAIQKRA